MGKKLTLYAPDISCEHCAMRIKRGLTPVEGVLAVDVNVADKAVALEVRDEAALARAKAVLEEIGYPPAER